jgi:Spy/CpxP family protein refolding chaperone
VSKSLAFVAAAGLLCASAVVAAQQAKPVSTTKPIATTPATLEDTLRAVRADLQGSRADIMAKNLTLTAEQAAKFWPIFEQYQKEQNVIIDEQMKGIQKYADSFQTLDDAGALALLNAHLTNDAKMTALRTKWLGEFQKVLPARLAARVIQIDRRLSMVQQMEFSSRIPLVH